MSTKASTVRRLAPAKLNLLLEVVNRRPDGYHEIDSLFVPVDLCDEVEVTTDPDADRPVSIACDDPAVPVDSRNTAWRAVEAFSRRHELGPVRVGLRKRIPAGAGLGGGSSDAAAVLRALAALAGSGDRPEFLLDAALEVGADVPFFLWSRPARVRGIGERVEPVTGLPSLAVAIAWPGFPISTRWAYAEADRTLTWPKTADRMRRFLSKEPGPLKTHNDFEEIVGRSHPEIDELKQRFLSLGADAAGLTGSGSAVFAIFADAAAAGRAAGEIRQRGRWAVSARTLQGAP